MAMFKKLLSFMVNRWVISILGLALLALLIWLLGPEIVVAGYAPLASEAARLVLIIICVLGWSLFNLLGLLRNRKTNQLVMDGLVGDSEETTVEDPSVAASREEIETLQERLQNALSILKRTKFGGRAGSRYLYQLPWYLIIGPPGAGKTTALYNSGLKFPLENVFGKNDLEIRGIGGTRNCDWWFTDEAVLLDTAGRYTTQESDETIDRSAWHGFLQLLRKYRRRRPIDGLIVAFSLEDMALKDSAYRRQHARAIRQRVQEIYSVLRIKVPVYLLFTKCDLLTGFSELFGDLDLEHRKQVWGVTFPLEQSKRPELVIERFPNEFDSLVERLSDRLLEQMEKERDPLRRGTIFSFPQQIASLKGGIQEFLADAFGPTRFEDPCFLRGVYFSSGTQEGTRIDGIIGAISRSFGLKQDAMPAMSGHGRSYFLTRLLQDVIFQEAELVTSTRWMDKHRPWILRGAYGLGGFATTLVLAALFVSYTDNKTFISYLESEIEKYRREQTVVSNISGALEALEPLRYFTGQETDSDGQTDLLFEFPFYQGEKLREAAQISYKDALNTLMLPEIGQRLENLIERNMGHGDDLYEALKVYLMLGQRERFNPDVVEQKIYHDLDDLFPGDTNGAFRQKIQAHLSALLEGERKLIGLNSQLIEMARRKLTELPLARRIYEQIKADQQVGNLKLWSLSSHISQDDLAYFRRQSKGPMSGGVPGFFTLEGYGQVFLVSLENQIRDALGETWVLGAGSSDRESKEDDDIAMLKREVSRLYFANYVREWDDLLADIDVISFTSAVRGAEKIAALSGTDSPFKAVLQAVAKETKLPDSLSGFGMALVKTQKLAKEGIAFFDDEKPKPGEKEEVANGFSAIVGRRFQQLHEVLREDGKSPPPIDGVLGELGDLAEYLNSIHEAGGAGEAAFAKFADPAEVSRSAVGKIQRKANDQPEPIRRWLLSLAQDTFVIMANYACARINSVWSSSVAPQCIDALDNRYPFVENSKLDANLIDFARVLGPGGIIEKFSKKYIEPLVDTSVKPWTWRRGGAISACISEDSLRQFESAAQIKEAFFSAGGTLPDIRFDIEPVYLDKVARRVVFELGDQRISYQFGPRRPHPLRWPSDREGARIVFTDSERRTFSRSARGPWDIFRLLKKGHVERGATDETLKTTFEVEGLRAVFLIRAKSIINPLNLPELKQFRCQDSLR